MSAIPMIQIRRQNAEVGMQTQPGSWEIRQPAANLEITTTPAQLDMHSPPGELRIDQSRAWDAVGLGSNLQFMHRIYSEAPDIALQGIARIVENGNRMAQIENHRNVIADIAGEQLSEDRPVNYFGEASCDNVDIEYTASKVELHVTDGHVETRFTPQKPETIYTKGTLDIYMLQYPKVDIIPPQIDVKL